MEAKTRRRKDAGQGPGAEPGLDQEAQRAKRIEAATLQAALAAKRCRNCSTVGCWRVCGREHDKGRVRYVKCLGCGNNEQVPVVVGKQEDAETRRRGDAERTAE